MIAKILKILLALVGLLALALAVTILALRGADYSHGQEPEWGVTFSTMYAQELGLDWQEMLRETLDDLGVRFLRVPIYWQEVEKEPGQYAFSHVEYILDEAHRRGAKVLLVLGMRQPRWPECHYPDWLEGASKEEMQEATLRLIQAEVDAFGSHPALLGWQVENEPLLSVFGECPPPDIDFLKEEIALVRKSSPKSIMITDSGELSTWRRSSFLAESFGTTMYRVVWNPVVGFFSYDFLPPAAYRIRADLVLQRDSKYPTRVEISELQAEPWVPGDYEHIADMPLEEQFLAWDEERLEEAIDYARRTGLSRAYLWGAEWWYWLKEKHGHAEYWDIAKKLFREDI